MKKKHVGLFVLFLVLAFPLSVNALSFETTALYSHTVVNSTSTTVDNDIADLDSGDTLPIGSQVTTPNGADTSFSGNPVAAAGFNASGYSRVLADGILWNLEASDPFNHPDVLAAEATMTDVYTNNSSSEVSLTYDFFLNSMQLLIADYAGADSGAPGAPMVSYSMEIYGQGSLLWSSSATIEGGFTGHTLSETGTDLGGTYFGGGNQFGYNFDFYSDVLELGTLGVGDSYELMATLAVSVAAAPFEMGGRAGFVDPGAFGAGGTLSATATGGGGNGQAPVPEPATLLLLGTGLLGLAGARKNRKR